MGRWKRQWTVLKIRDIFITGLFVFIPIAITVWLVIWLLTFVNSLILPYIRYIIPIPNIPGVGILLTLILIFVTGLIAQNYFGKKVIDYWDRIINRIPLVRSVYYSIKQMMENLFNSKGKFSKTVLVDFPRKGMLSIGFVANEVELNGEEYYLVYVPTAPNPTSGYTLFVKKSETIHTDLSVEEATRIILSGGLVTKDSVRFLLKDGEKNRASSDI
ncbi:MAG TPA: DUF502 domain-containing protein [Persephonella sp.]|uniref:DUF502 domain-containing protein n=1 Tax=Persephonella TaxID=182899 RepID=UPI0006748205|nr:MULTISPECIES: DUF502 domain-containing protein [Persephonella]HCB69220.1 DUF502 domain-containing protein [Persephonella sp.]